jgi:branched-chain amino acid transport system permease protein
MIALIKLKIQRSWFTSIPLFLIFFLGPIYLPSNILIFLLYTYLWLTMALNLDIIVGMLGYINLSQGVFFGLAGYAFIIILTYLEGAIGATGMLAGGIALLASLLITIAFAAAISLPYFRLRGGYFAVATLVVFLLMERLAYNLRGVTGGSYGIYLPRAYVIDLSVAYLAGLSITAFSILLNYLILSSKLGLTLLALREDEEAAMSLGIKPLKYKSIALIISSVPTALAGAIYVLNSGWLDPRTAFGAERNLLPLIMVLLGGSGTLTGPVVGVIVMRFFDLLLREYIMLPLPPLIVYGALLLLVTRFMPGGIVRSWLFLTLRRRSSLLIEGMFKKIN